MTYDGPDLGSVAEHCGLSVDEVVERHERTEFVVAFCGFAPGFAYLSGLPDELHVPRLAEPRSRVPAGSVGLAGGFTGIYPRASPGGWQLIARTEETLWDPDREPPALLVPGTVVQVPPCLSALRSWSRTPGCRSPSRTSAARAGPTSASPGRARSTCPPTGSPTGSSATARTPRRWSASTAGSPSRRARR